VSGAHDALNHDAAAYALGALASADRTAFEAHLASCPQCAEDVRQMRLAAGALAHAVPQIAPPPTLRARILIAAAPHDAQPLGMAETAARDVGGQRRRRLPAWLPIAALLVFGAGLFGYAQRLQVRIANLEMQLSQAQARVTAADRFTAEARAVAIRAQNAMGVFAAPDLARIELAGQPSARSASARALWSRQRGMVFTVANLPAPPPGRVYQVWVVTAQAPVSAGLLTPDAAGGGSVYFETPVDIPPPVAVAVTIEPAGGVPAPTGERYLIGTPSPL
jgi:anti-sigma-K factor RskA